MWRKPGEDGKIFLTFDDGPHPLVTPSVLDILKINDAKATFFCLGKNVLEYPGIFNRIQSEGHAVGNHSYGHPDGWKVSSESYVNDVNKAAEIIPSSLFRPPYGRITPSQISQLRSRFEIVMWSVLSRDYEEGMDSQAIVKNVSEHLKPGAIIVFHDNEKTVGKLETVLPEIIKTGRQMGLKFSALSSEKKF